jgi:hypothetical protein
MSGGGNVRAYILNVAADQRCNCNYVNSKVAVFACAGFAGDRKLSLL